MYPNSTIFFNDLPQNVKTAVRAGFKIETIKAVSNEGWFSRNLRDSKNFVEFNWQRWQDEVALEKPQSSSPNPSSSKEPPKHQLLLKLLNMTGSSNDGEALTAIRKATELLSSAGWTWEKLLSGKITVVEDPFSKMPEINREETTSHRQPTAPPPPRRPTPPPAASVPPRGAYFSKQARNQTTPDYSIRPTRAPQKGYQWDWDPIFGLWEELPTASAAPLNPQAVSGAEISSRTNNYANNCYCCGTYVDSKEGFIFQGADYALPSKWHTVCKSCNTSVKIISRTAAKKKIPLDQQTYKSTGPFDNSWVNKL